MLTKSLLTIAILTSLSATAQAGSTISDKNYWPSEVRRETLTGAAIPQRDPNSAFAYDRTISAYGPTTSAIAGGSAWRYQGGPKSR